MRRDRASRHDLGDRDQRLEDDYHYTRDREDRGLSTLASVTLHREELAREFLGRDRGLFEGQTPTEEDLRAWEGRRFGAQLELAAHGLLWVAVRQSINWKG